MTALRSDRVRSTPICSRVRALRQDHVRAHPRPVPQLRGRPHRHPPAALRQLRRTRGAAAAVLSTWSRSTRPATTVVDDARDSRERAIFATARDRFKIFILDEAHMVTQAGLQRPCSSWSKSRPRTSSSSSPPPSPRRCSARSAPPRTTIRSDWCRGGHARVRPRAMCGSGAWGPVEAGVLPLVVRAGGGSPRDTLSLLDQLIAGYDPATGSETAPAGADPGALRARGRSSRLHAFELLDEVVDAFGERQAGGPSRGRRVVQTGQTHDASSTISSNGCAISSSSPRPVAGASAVLRGVPDDELDA